MKLKNMIFLSSILFLVLLCIGSACAADDNATSNVTDNDAPQIETDIEQVSENGTSDENSNGNGKEVADVIASNTDPNTTSTATPKVAKKSVDVFCTNAFIQKSNKYFTVKVFTFNEKTNKLNYYKNVKLTVKVKIGSTTKTYNVKTNSKGEAKVLNVKNLKVGTYKVTVASNDEKYNVKEKGTLAIFNKKQKSITLKMNTRKKVKNDYIEAFYFTKNGQFPKGAYVTEYNAKNPMNGISHTLIMKAKFFFKNKKTGKIIAKTVKSKTSKIYGWDYPEHKLIKGYTPLKATIWYVRY